MSVDHSLADWQELARFPSNTSLPHVADVDVVVVGGGAAGVAAAVIAAEHGLSVALVEQYGFAGGAAVAGMSGTICGLYSATNTPSAPEQLVFGFAERFRAGLEFRGGLTEPQRYGKTWVHTHDPIAWSQLADDFLTTAGVRVIFHAAVTGVLIDDGEACRGVILESKAGRSIVTARRVIDASGDAAVIARAGWLYGYGDEGRLQSPTMIFKLGNVDVDAFTRAWGPDTISPEWVSARIVGVRDKGSDLPREHIWCFPMPGNTQIMVNATRLTGANSRPLNSVDPEDFTEAEIIGRRQVVAYAEFLRREVPGLQSSVLTGVGIEAGIRQTRTVRGVETLTALDVVSAGKRADSICHSPWPIELHDSEGSRLHWLFNDTYDVAYGTLIPRTGENVIVAGRCLSAEHEALASARVTAQCFEYGHAAAIASVLSLRGNVPLRDLDVQEIRQCMVAGGSRLS